MAVNIFGVRKALKQYEAENDRGHALWASITSADALLRDKAIGDDNARAIAWLRAVTSVPDVAVPDELRPAMESARTLLLAHTPCFMCGMKGAPERTMPDGTKVLWCSGCEAQTLGRTA